MTYTKILILFLATIAIGLFIIKKTNQNQSTITPDASPLTLTKSNSMTPSNTDTTTQTTTQTQLDPQQVYLATLQTDLGNIVIQLNTKDTPITATNFLSLADKGFYNNTVFHRVINGFMIQGGDPKGDGTGGPGYQFDDEPFTGEYARGAVAMANAGPNTNGSQFFIMHQDYALAKNYVIFGQVIEGLDTVDKIATAAVTAGLGGENSKPVKPIAIQSVTLSSQASQ